MVLNVCTRGIATVSDQILVENDVSALAGASALAWFDDIIDCCFGDLPKISQQRCMLNSQQE